MNVGELLQRVDELYPNGEENETKVHYMNIAIDTLFPEFGITKVDESLYTQQGEDEYAFPVGIEDIEQVYDLSIGNRPIPSNRHDYIQYSFGYEDEAPMAGRIFFQVYDSSGNKKLGLNPIPAAAGFPIRIKYRKQFANLDHTDLTQVPEIRSEYHMLLVFYAAYSVASAGASPDSVQADSFMQRYDTLLLSMWQDKMVREAENPKRRKDNPTWRRNR